MIQITKSTHRIGKVLPNNLSDKGLQSQITKNLSNSKLQRKINNPVDMGRRHELIFSKERIKHTENNFSHQLLRDVQIKSMVRYHIKLLRVA